MGLKKDFITGGLVAIEYEHHEIHGGNSFMCHYSVDVSDITHRTAITFKTADTLKLGHFVASVHASSVAMAYIYEDVIIDGGSAGEPAAVVIYNRYRDGTGTSGFISQHATPVAGGASGWTEALLLNGATGGDGDWVISTATELDKFPLGGGTNPVRSIGGSERGTSEIILKQNAVYMIMIQSLDNEDNTHIIRLDWYEHTSRQKI